MGRNKVLTKSFMISEYKGLGISVDFKTMFLILRVHLTVGVPSDRSFDFN